MIVVTLGSVLGPLPNSRCLNEVGKGTEDCLKTMSTDDTSLVRSRQNANPLSDSDISHVSKFFNDNKLTVSKGKCKRKMFY